MKSESLGSLFLWSGDGQLSAPLPPSGKSTGVSSPPGQGSAKVVIPGSGPGKWRRQGLGGEDQSNLPAQKSLLSQTPGEMNSHLMILTGASVFSEIEEFLNIDLEPATWQMPV